MSGVLIDGLVGFRFSKIIFLKNYNSFIELYTINLFVITLLFNRTNKINATLSLNCLTFTCY